jgi:lipopolysaccharide transport system ATP-binding protein
MSDIAIRVEHLGKQYRLGGQQVRYATFREALVNAANAPLRWLNGNRSSKNNTFWALDDVSFEVKHGEAVGIIGRNGAGKSTLLKVLSRITSPTRGRVDIYGRVGSLLEVGTGFHPELTGRENIYLNGAILGMSRKEIDSKFDEIVAFAEIERFLDTPVKFYSSGMYVRLAFAVAAHLEPEILVVDEVLAVGDAEFQKKCLGKMGDVAHEGRTVLFVSHNMAAISSLCKSGILLDLGQMINQGDIKRVVSEYLNPRNFDESYNKAEDPDLDIQIISARVINDEGIGIIQHPFDRSFFINFKIAVKKNLSRIYIAIHVHDSNLETIIFSRDFDLDQKNLLDRAAGIYEYKLNIPGNLLVPDMYRISIHIAWANPPEIIDRADFICPFEIIDDNSNRAKAGFPWRGKIAVLPEWKYFYKELN